MEKQQENREELIREIITLELEMFQSVNARERSLCQELPETFRIMRWMAHSVLSQETLESYLDDLKQASNAGRNLMTEKYARMEDLIPPLKESPEIVAVLDEIIETEEDWMYEFSQRYPHITKGDGDGFSQYLRCELETYSDRTLELYLKNVRNAKAREINLAELSYKNLFRMLGYESLDNVGRDTNNP